jgi:hypothetical protein
MDSESAKNQSVDIKSGVNDILNLIQQDREKEIITRRFGLYDRKETLEQIGELLGITRERVRQLEKAILSKLRNTLAAGNNQSLSANEKSLIRHLSELGRISKVDALADKVFNKTTDSKERSHISFVASLSPSLMLVEENDNYHASVSIADSSDEKKIKGDIDEIVGLIKKHGQPISTENLHSLLNHEHPSQVRALASISKNLAELNENWGLIKWPSVNPRNIRDKIYVILDTAKKPMHFSEISEKIKESGFKRKDVTTQAIHNELIKDDRFVLIGRGIYALTSWGYSKGTVSEIIADVLKEAGVPLHRDEIVKKVLEKRQVKETTILLNLQSKPEFKRVAKATYTLA